ncbi:Enoyl-(Acyl carrier protein) reductase [Salinibacterium xinjiangense]|uniref:Enoyl-(Acyl carrier protein) reductase n=1 Tax=Salinibacterium xinjiangense TaxID=386302 RepID=A0A2C8Z5W3_9MICO|nr:Enoyl-(Acyl carrier protein) reductase [Salinibacterium xinjiangense]
MSRMDGPMSESEFSGLVAEVTGGRSGLGLASARELSRRGASTWILDLDPRPRCVPARWAVHRRRMRRGPRSIGGKAIDIVVSSAGQLDIVIANAGIGAQGTIEDNDGAEWRRVFEVRVNAVVPGTADTPWIGRLLSRAADPQAERDALEQRQPLGSLVGPEEVADVVAHLASPRSGSTTGVILPVDGRMNTLRVRPGRTHDHG